MRTFKSKIELLIGLRDAVKAHRSLLQDARILHQDFSIDNILLIDPVDGSNEEPSGLLIDLDFAMPIDKGPRPGELRVGNRPYMAIGVMDCDPHTYRHDLESLLYTLIRILIVDERDSVPEDSLLKTWVSGKMYQSADAKREQMTEDGFGKIMEEIPERYKSLCPLAERLRGILFPLNESGEIFVGTVVEKVDEVFDAVLRAFEDAIVHERAG